MNKTRGRPPGKPATKQRITDAAYRLFLEHGYRRTTLRAIAAEAAVDSALIGYHFGSKQGLFAECMRLRLSPAAALDQALRGPADTLPERILAAVTALWDDPEVRTPLSALVAQAMADDEAGRVFHEFIEREVIARIAEFLGGRDAATRAGAAAAVIGGLIFTRYLVPMSPNADLSRAEVQRAVGPALRAALAGQPRASVQRPPRGRT